jgi:hypothetical protein
LVLIWVTPDLPISLRAPITITFFLMLVVNICVPYYYTVQVAALPWISARRVTRFHFHRTLSGRCRRLRRRETHNWRTNSLFQADCRKRRRISRSPFPFPFYFLGPRRVALTDDRCGVDLVCSLFRGPVFVEEL